MATVDRQRRRFLSGLILLAGGLALLWRFLVPRRKQPETVLLEVERDSIPLRGALVYQQSRIVVIRREEEIYALSLVCTHLGCTVNVTPDKLVCPCHGSSFERDGRVISGPADKPLKRLPTRLEGDKVVVLA